VTEAQAFVLIATQVVKEESLEKLNMAGFPLFKTVYHLTFDLSFDYVLMDDVARWRVLSGLWSRWSTSGQSVPGEEGIVTAVADLKDTDYAKGMINIVGHYSKPYLLSLLVNPNAAKIVTEMD
jgi:nitrilase